MYTHDVAKIEHFLQWGSMGKFYVFSQLQLKSPSECIKIVDILYHASYEGIKKVIAKNCVTN